MRGSLLLVLLLGVSGDAVADDSVTAPRAIGRAGTGVVSDDSGGALFANPASLARRKGWRLQLGFAVVDDDMSLRPDMAEAPRATTMNSATFPASAAVIATFGPLTAAAGAFAASRERRLPAPVSGLDAVELGRQFSYRYAGLSASRRELVWAVGIAARVGDSLAVGVGAELHQREVSERRRIWAGFSGRDPVLAPEHDVDLVAHGTDSVIPGGRVGAFYAPSWAPVEFAAAAGFVNGAQLRGNIGASSDPAVVALSPAAAAAAQLSVPGVLVVTSGARYLGERWSLEAQLDWRRVRSTSHPPRWAITSANVVDYTGASAPLTSLPSRLMPASTLSTRAAVDVEILDGLLWLSGGYAWLRSSFPADQLSATLGELDGHVTALGAEVSSGAITLHLGIARTWRPRSRVTGSGRPRSRVTGSALSADDPFEPGTAPVGNGIYRGSVDELSLSVEFACP
jgi:hypothetical protein